MQTTQAADFSVRRIMSEIVGHSPAIVRLRRALRKIAKSDDDTLITGEVGVGKALFAHVIHKLSNRRDYPFVEIHAIEYKAQIGNSAKHAHQFSQVLKSARGGIVAIYCVEELPDYQRFQLQEFLLGLNGFKENIPGEKRPRIIATSTLNARSLQNEKMFPPTLFFKLNQLMLDVPPLRKRKQDIPFLFAYFYKKYMQKMERHFDTGAFTDELYDAMMGYEWKGNVDELKNAVRTLLVTAENGSINPSILPFLKSTDQLKMFADKSLPEAVQIVERYLLKKALVRFEGNQTKAAQHLQISEAALRYKLKKYQLSNK